MDFKFIDMTFRRLKELRIVRQSRFSMNTYTLGSEPNRNSKSLMQKHELTLQREFLILGAETNVNLPEVHGRWPA